MQSKFGVTVPDILRLHGEILGQLKYWHPAAQHCREVHLSTHPPIPLCSDDFKTCWAGGLAGRVRPGRHSNLLSLMVVSNDLGICRTVAKEQQISFITTSESLGGGWKGIRLLCPESCFCQWHAKSIPDAPLPLPQKIHTGAGRGAAKGNPNEPGLEDVP